MNNPTLTIHPIIVPIRYNLKSFNFYLVKVNEQLTLIDAGFDSENNWKALQETLEKIGSELKDITKIILTHSHEDHTGLVNRIIAEHDIPVYVHIDAEKRLKRKESFLQKRMEFFQQLYTEMGCEEKGAQRVAELKKSIQENKTNAIHATFLPLKEGDVIDGLQVFETPGHWPDHICLFHRETGAFFSGDHMVEHISSNAMIEPDGQGKRLPTISQYERALEKCLSLPLKTAYPGHGNIIEQPSKLIQKRLQGIERKSKKIKDVIAKLQPCTAAQIAQELYQDKYESEFNLVMSEIIGHIDRLESKGNIKKTKSKDVWLYKLFDANSQKG